MLNQLLLLSMGLIFGIRLLALSPVEANALLEGETHLPANLSEEMIRKTFEKSGEAQILTLDDSSGAKLQFTARLDFTHLYDRDLVSEMNVEASHVWSEYIGCASGDTRQAVLSYFLENECASSRINLMKFKQSVHQYLVTSDFRYENPVIISECRHVKDGSACSVDELKQAGRSALPSIKGPLFHPLFVQVVLEQVAAGMPYGYSIESAALRDASALVQFLRSAEIQGKMDQVDFGSEYYPQIRLGDKWIVKTLHPINKKNFRTVMTRERLAILARKSLNGRFLLSTMSLSAANQCGTWGLSPDTTRRALFNFVASLQLQQEKRPVYGVDITTENQNPLFADNLTSMDPLLTSMEVSCGYNYENAKINYGHFDIDPTTDNNLSPNQKRIAGAGQSLRTLGDLDHFDPSAKRMLRSIFDDSIFSSLNRW